MKGNKVDYWSRISGNFKWHAKDKEPIQQCSLHTVFKMWKATNNRIMSVTMISACTYKHITHFDEKSYVHDF
jgi:hypothetical protein